MRYERAVVTAPATIANFGPGFDSFGLCLDSPRDTISLRASGSGTVTVRVLGKQGLPTEPEKNTASYSAMRMAELCDCHRVGFTMTVRKGMKPGSGIGSSASSSVGGALAMATLLGVKEKGLVLEAAAMGEEMVAGSRHFDNVAAALFGGFTVVADLRTRTILKIKPPRFQIVVVIPDITIETRMARGVLPRAVSVADAVCNVSWGAGMVHAMMSRNVRAIGCYLDDKLAVPYRSKLIPGFDRVREAAHRAGALGVSIGGSGPAVFAISQGNAQRVRKAMVEAFKESAGLGSDSFITVPGAGAKVESIS